MKTLILSILLLSPCSAATYYLATAADGGSDSNNGTSTGTPWLSPNHAVNCGDVIIAKASTAYSYANFAPWMWGTVTCAAGNNVAWLKCETFDGCKITATNQTGMKLAKSYWGVQGWEVSATGNNGVCFMTLPTGGATIHHIVFANNVCNGGANGFTASGQSSTASVDYWVVVGNIAWNATQSTVYGNSGITMYEPIKSDSDPGTHIYIAGNFSFDNLSTVQPYDGNGIVLDDIGGVQNSYPAYDQRIVVENNLAVWNGGYGFGNTGNGTSAALITWRYNTSAYNLTDTGTDTTTCGDFTLLRSRKTTVYGNLIVTGRATACSSGNSLPLYAFAVNEADGTVAVTSNWLYSAAGNNTIIISSMGFTYGANVTGTDPQLPNPVDPGRPNCAGKANTTDCMATVTANYQPQKSAARPYGRQPVKAVQTYDPYFPQWLCNVNLPRGLITTHCITPATYNGY